MEQPQGHNNLKMRQKNGFLPRVLKSAQMGLASIPACFNILELRHSTLLIPPSPYPVCIDWILSLCQCPEDEKLSKKSGQEHICLKTVRPLQGAEQARWPEGALVPGASCRELLGETFAVAHS